MGGCLGDLQDKEVINVCDGRRLGYICDVEADVCTGQIAPYCCPGRGVPCSDGAGAASASRGRRYAASATI